MASNILLFFARPQIAEKFTAIPTSRNTPIEALSVALVGKGTIGVSGDLHPLGTDCLIAKVDGPG